jgi:hypothetical protein
MESKVYDVYLICISFYAFLGAFTELRKATTSFIMSGCPPLCLSVRPSVHIEELGSHGADFHEI